MFHRSICSYNVHFRFLFCGLSLFLPIRPLLQIFPIFMPPDWSTMSKKRTPKLLAGYTHHNKVRLVHGGSDYFTTLLQIIDQAEIIVHLQTYIYEDDETGRM